MMKKKYLPTIAFLFMIVFFSFYVDYGAAVAFPLFLLIGEGLNQAYLKTGEFSLVRGMEYTIKRFIGTLTGMSIVITIFILPYFLSSIYNVSSVWKFIILALLALFYVVTFPLYTTVLRWAIEKYNMAKGFRIFWKEIRKNKKEAFMVYLLTWFGIFLLFVNSLPIQATLTTAIFIIEFSPSVYEYTLVKKRRKTQGS